MGLSEKLALTIEELVTRLEAARVLLGSGVVVKCSLQFDDRSSGRNCKFGHLVDVYVDGGSLKDANKILWLVAEERW